MWEFLRLHKRQQQEVDKDKRVTGLDFQASRNNVPKVFNF